VTQPVDPLTEREEEVLVLLARGHTNAEIAAELYIGLSTVKSHVASLMAKLGVRNRVEIAMWAYHSKRAVTRAAGDVDHHAMQRATITPSPVKRRSRRLCAWPIQTTCASSATWVAAPGWTVRDSTA
jgi:DNA-binding CsgD family transcriptional regulator